METRFFPLIVLSRLTKIPLHGRLRHVEWKILLYSRSPLFFNFNRSSLLLDHEKASKLVKKKKKKIGRAHV